MSAYNTNFKQEMPPKGGYNEIHYQRIPAQRLVGYKPAFFVSCLLTGYGFFYYRRRLDYGRKMLVDYNDSLIAIEPLALAEQDRAFLRQVRHNRNVERDLMKNVPDWEVGTLWGKKIFNNVPENEIPPIELYEFYGHRPNVDARRHTKPNRDVGFEDNFN